MSNLMRYAGGQAVEPLSPGRLNRFEEHRRRQALTRLEVQADLQMRAVELEAEIGHAKVQAVTDVGNAAITAQALLSGLQRLLVEAEPTAVHGISYLASKLTAGLGAVIDEVVQGITD